MDLCHVSLKKHPWIRQTFSFVVITISRSINRYDVIHLHLQAELVNNKNLNPV